MYNKIKSSIEKKKSKEEPKIRNDNFYKCNIKHINIFIGDVNPNLDSCDNTMFNNINISKENIRQNTIEYNNQMNKMKKKRLKVKKIMKKVEGPFLLLNKLKKNI